MDAPQAVILGDEMVGVEATLAAPKLIYGT